MMYFSKFIQKLIRSLAITQERGIILSRKKYIPAIFSRGLHSSMHGSKVMLCIKKCDKQMDEWTNRWTDERTDGLMPQNQYAPPTSLKLGA